MQNYQHLTQLRRRNIPVRGRPEGDAGCLLPPLAFLFVSSFFLFLFSSLFGQFLPFYFLICPCIFLPLIFFLFPLSISFFYQPSSSFLYLTDLPLPSSSSSFSSISSFFLLSIPAFIFLPLYSLFSSFLLLPFFPYFSLNGVNLHHPFLIIFFLCFPFSTILPFSFLSFPSLVTLP